MRRVLRTHRSVTWISAGLAEAGHLERHCLVRVVAEELEASSKGCHAQSFAGWWFSLLRTIFFFFNPSFVNSRNIFLCREKIL